MRGGYYSTDQVRECNIATMELIFLQPAPREYDYIDHRQHTMRVYCARRRIITESTSAASNRTIQHTGDMKLYPFLHAQTPIVGYMLQYIGLLASYDARQLNPFYRANRIAQRGIAMISCPSVCYCLSVTLTDCDYMRWNSSKKNFTADQPNLTSLCKPQYHGSTPKGTPLNFIPTRSGIGEMSIFDIQAAVSLKKCNIRSLSYY